MSYRLGYSQRGTVDDVEDVIDLSGLEKCSRHMLLFGDRLSVQHSAFSCLPTDTDDTNIMQSKLPYRGWLPKRRYFEQLFLLSTIRLIDTTAPGDSRASMIKRAFQRSTIHQSDSRSIRVPEPYFLLIEHSIRHINNPMNALTPIPDAPNRPKRPLQRSPSIPFLTWIIPIQSLQ